MHSSEAQSLPLPERSLTLAETRYIRQRLDVIDLLWNIPQSTPEFADAALRATADLLHSLSGLYDGEHLLSKSSETSGPWVVGYWEQFSRFEGDVMGEWVIFDIFSDVNEAREEVKRLNRIHSSLQVCLLDVPSWEEIRREGPIRELGSLNTESSDSAEIPSEHTDPDLLTSLAHTYQNSREAPALLVPDSGPQPTFRAAPGTQQWAEDRGVAYEID
jgi:hypothetical protein